MAKDRLTLIFALLILLAVPSAARAGWLIDQAPLHASAHAGLSCLECHQDAAEGPHPDPALLNRPPDHAAGAAMCAQCHDSAAELAATGSHGGRPITNAGQLADCLACHAPHATAPAGGWPKAYDPAKPMAAQCGACHEPKAALPPLSAEDQACASCHLANPMDPAGTRADTRRMCLSCHGQRHQGFEAAGLIDPLSLDAPPHGGMACASCHQGATSFPHSAQDAPDCLSCHQRHAASTARHAHLDADCLACHQAQGTPRRDAATGLIVMARQKNAPWDPHALRGQADEASCRRCHYQANELGAPAAVLPAKGLICMACHPTTGSVADWVNAPALIILVLGLLLMVSVWTSAPAEAKPLHAGSPKGGAFRWGPALKALLMDGLLQRRLWRAAPGRWAAHGLIYYAMALRCLWGLAAWIGTAWAPAWTPGWLLLDDKAPLTSAVYDITGLMIIGGAVALALRRFGEKRRPSGLPRPDYPAIALLALAVVSGFVVEAVGQALPGAAPAPGAFVGRALAALPAGTAGLPTFYGWLWYAHAALWGLFVAYLPFGRMRHMILSPISLALNAGRGHGESGDH